MTVNGADARGHGYDSEFLGVELAVPVPTAAILGNELYVRNPLDRGHLARRADLTWGELGDAQQANRDSFSFTNIAPQMDDFNQSSRQGLWGRLEDALYEDVDVDDLRVSVMAGPVFSQWMHSADLAEGDSVGAPPRRPLARTRDIRW
ncbi:DNA/RNA non-specific endonuclease [Rhodoglobus sp.]